MLLPPQLPPLKLHQSPAPDTSWRSNLWSSFSHSGAGQRFDQWFVF